MSGLVRWRPALIFVVGALVAGCLKEPQFHLEVPARDAPLPERIAAHERLEPRVVRGTEIFNYDSLGGRHLEFIDELELADGTIIYSPEVLRQAVLPGSHVDLLIDDYVDVKRRAHRLAWVGRGIGLSAIPLAIGAAVADDDVASESLWYASLGSFATWVVLRLVTRSLGQRRERAQGLVFSSFGDGLLERLALCRASDGTLGGCALAPPPSGVRLRIAR